MRKILALMLLIPCLGCQNAKDLLLKKAFEKDAELIGQHIDPTPIRLCSELSADEVKKILGPDYSAKEWLSGRECRFDPAGTSEGKFSVNFELFDSPEAAEGFLKGRNNTVRTFSWFGKGMSPQAIPGLGDEAYWAHNPHAPLGVWAIDGRKYFSVNIYGSEEDDSALVEKAKILIAKLSEKIP